MIPLEKDERIITEVRAHKFFIIIDALYALASIVGPLIILMFMVLIPALDGITRFLLSLWPLYPLYILLIWSQFMITLTFYFMRYLVITNQRIVEVEQKGFFDREVSAFRLENIQDITVDIQGIIPSLLDFGDVHIQTASKDRDFKIERAPHPEELKLLISEEHERLMSKFRVPGQMLNM